MRRLRFCALLALAPAVSFAAVDFTQATATEIPASVFQTAAGRSDTAAIDSVTLAPSGDLFVTHRDSLARETFLRTNIAGTVVTALATEADAVSDLGGPYGPALVQEGGFSANTTNGRLFFMESFSGEFALLSVDTATAGAPVSQVLRSVDLADTIDHAVLPTGEIVIARGAEGLGIVDPAAGTPAWQLKVSEADFLAAIPAGPTECPPEAVAANPVTGEIFVFCHDALELFRIQNVTTTPTVTRVVIPGWNGAVDLHDVAVDADGNFYAFDEPTERILIWDGTTAHEYTLGDIAELVRGPSPTPPVLGASLYRGIAVRKVGADQAELFIASATPDYGVVRVLFGGASSVADWSVY